MLVNIFSGGGYSFGVRAEEPEKTWAFQKNGVLVEQDGANQEKTGPVLESFSLSNNPSDLKIEINKYTDYPSSENSGCTFTQAGLMKANKLFGDNNTNIKVIVLVSDGEPTYGYDKKYEKVIGNGNNLYLKTIRENTIAEAKKIKGDDNKKVTIYSVSVAVTNTGENILSQISTSPNHYSEVDTQANQILRIMQYLTK